MKLNTITSTVTRPANTTAYAANDVIASSTTAGNVVPLQFNNLMNTRAGTGYITKALLWVDGSAFTSPLRLYLFNDVPTDIADNAQFPLTFANSTAHLGYIDFLFCTTGGTGSDVALAEIDDLRIPIQSKDITGSNPVYGILVSQAGFTPTSGQRFRVQLAGDAYEF